MRLYILSLFTLLTLSAEAQTNYALSFNGTNQYVNIGSPLPNNTSYTKEAWVYVTNLTGSRNIISTANAPFWLTGGLLAAGHGAVYTQVVDPTTFPTNKWTHVAVTYNSATTTMRLYRDGILVSTNALVPSNYGSQTTFIASHAGSGSYLQGLVDEVRIWNVARTQAEIKQNLLYPPENNASGLVAYYKLDDAAGSTAVNSTGGTNGSLQNTPAWQASPAQFAGNALDFDGANDAATVADHSTLDITSAITLEAWVYAKKNTGIQNVVSKSSQSANNGYIFPRTDNGWVTTVLYLHVGGSWRTLSAPYPSLNAWHHLAATYNGTHMRLYIDGSEVTSTTQTGAITQNNNVLALGNQPGYSEFFGGVADEVRIWNVARSPAQILANMNVNLNPASEPNLVSYFTFNQGITNGNNSGMTTIVDMKNQNNGALTNFALSGTTSNFVIQNAVLPLQWLSFTAEKLDKSIRLKWSTASERNTKDFIVQHGTDGTSWNNIATVAASIHSDEISNYFYLYANPVNGLNYFRIKQRDIDGRFNFSEIKTITFTSTNPSFNILNNPVNNGSMQIKIDKKREISFYNSEGKLMWKRTLLTGTYSIDVSRYAKGLYFLRDEKSTIKLIIR